jgi:hypothetical protein
MEQEAMVDVHPKSEELRLRPILEAYGLESAGQVQELRQLDSARLLLYFERQHLFEHLLHHARMRRVRAVIEQNAIVQYQPLLGPPAACSRGIHERRSDNTGSAHWRHWR